MHGQVITPSAGGPAEKAGIEPRDGLVAIDGKQTEGLSLYEAGDMLQGAEGSEVTFQSCILPSAAHGQEVLTVDMLPVKWQPVKVIDDI